MKRSKSVSLILLGTVSAIALSGCNDDDRPQDGQAIYESVDQCTTAANPFSRCFDAHRYALGNHVGLSPQYQTEAECIAIHDRCMYLKPNGTDVWLPAMIGFTIAGNLSASRPVYVATGTDQERAVVSGPMQPGGTFVFIGSYYHPGGIYVPGTLSTGMNASTIRANGTTVTSVVSSTRPATVNAVLAGRAASSVAARGGFGAAGHGASGG